ncbi:MAG: NAD(P)-binding protein, partial [Emcibacteraceae bacterium]|nr:NAD(P)-binding protein [Emcibacteraceae bacterium]
MQTDVVIIGAGSAGLAAAKELTKNNVSFIVIEASHRIGGRAYSEELAPNVWFDLGCAYLMQGTDSKNQIDESNPFIDYAKSQGEVLEKYDHDEHYIYNGEALDENISKEREKFFSDCEDAIKCSAESGDDHALSDVIDLESPYMIPYNDIMVVSAPKDIDEISVADTFFGVGGYEDYITPNGYGNIVAKWGSDVKVSLNTKV